MKKKDKTTKIEEKKTRIKANYKVGSKLAKQRYYRKQIY